MAGLIVLVTGMTRFVGSSLAGRLSARPGVDRVIGVDAALPEPAARARMGAAEFARVDIRNPLIAKVIHAAGVDTVIHASASSTPASSAARSMAKEMNVLGTMQLLAACQRADSVRSIIVRSSGAIYGASSRDPAIFTEDMPARSVPSAGPGRDAIDIEAYVRGFGRRRPDVRIAVPRFADIIGPTVVTPLTRYFALSPVVPTVLGRDSRLQFVHEVDAVAVLEQLALGDFAGSVNVAGDGVITVAQAIHRAGRLPLPLPPVGLNGLARAMRTFRVGGFSPGQVRSLSVGRVLDTSRLRTEVGYTPRYSTVEAFDDYASTLQPAVPPGAVQQVERRLTRAFGLALPDQPGSRSTGQPPAPAAIPLPDATAPRAPIVSGQPEAARAPGRPHLVGITGQGPGAPHRRRTSKGGGNGSGQR